MSATAEAITALLAKYNEALNASSTEAVMPRYSFSPTNPPRD